MFQRIFIILLVLAAFSNILRAQDIYKVTADNLRVRASSSLDSKITGFIPQNENVMVLDSSNAKYFKVKLTNGEGWVRGEYLTRVSPPNVIKKAEPAKPIVLQSTGKDYSKTIFVTLVAVVLLTLLFIVFKFMHNKILIGVATIIVLAAAYTFYMAFLIEKTVAGKYIGTDDAAYKYLEFKPNRTVTLQDATSDSLSSANYDIEGDLIKFKQQENTILLLIRDENTLIGEGFTRGTFEKK